MSLLASQWQSKSHQLVSAPRFVLRIFLFFIPSKNNENIYIINQLTVLIDCPAKKVELRVR